MKKFEISLTGKHEDKYIFDEAADGNIMDEIKAILDEIKSGNIDSVTIRKE